MCGIAGIFNSVRLPSREVLIEEAARMSATLRHRGPDDGGAWIDEERGIAFSHRRLSIVDLSRCGHQPMVSANGRYVLTYNGEIYNHEALRRELERSSQHADWRGRSDTETMLAAFSAWGIEKATKRFVGMFAFAVWDRETRTLTLGRDRFGEKPLYCGWMGTTFLFGSELNALRANPNWNSEIDRRALTLLMRFNYVPGPYCIYKNVRKLTPGTLLSINSFGEESTVTYWSAEDAIKRGLAEPFTGNEGSAVEALDRLLREAVSGQMMSDVPIGAFLSGGIDSSLVTALMQAAASRPVQTFSIGFEQKQFDESGFAAAVAQHLGTAHTALIVSDAEALSAVPKMSEVYDEPFGDSSQVPTFLVAHLARQHVTVSLSGDGGDELFGGYERYVLGCRLDRRRRSLPLALRRVLARGIHSVQANESEKLGFCLAAFGRGKGLGEKLHRIAAVLPLSSPDFYKLLMSHCREPERLVVGGDDPPTKFKDSQPGKLSFFELMMAIDTVTYLADDILTKVDRAGMAVSLESRMPLLDHRVFEFAWSLPKSAKLRGTDGKWILKEVLKRHVPPGLFDRPKMGFAVPLGAWLRGPLRGWADGLLDETLLRSAGLLNADAVGRLWRGHLAGKEGSEHVIWNVVMFQAWFMAQQTRGFTEPNESVLERRTHTN